eukprot:COSAG01_NODE_37153_length_507_cov_6.426471_1_plen_96_part_01
MGPIDHLSPAAVMFSQSRVIDRPHVQPCRQPAGQAGSKFAGLRSRNPWTLINVHGSIGPWAQLSAFLEFLPTVGLAMVVNLRRGYPDTVLAEKFFV